MVNKGKPELKIVNKYFLLLPVAAVILLLLSPSAAQVRRGQNDPVDTAYGQPPDTVDVDNTSPLAPVAPLIGDNDSAVYLKDPVAAATDSAIMVPDSLLPADSSVSDSAKTLLKEQQLGIKISKDALPAKVVTTARDSAVMDMTSNMYYLYGDADVKYKEIELKGGKVVFQQSTSVVTAEPERDTAGNKVSVQEFSQGGEKFTYDSLQYNFKSKRAVVRNARSQYGEGFVISEQVKRNADETIYGWKNIYTTCNLDHPHFGIRANRIKVIPNRIIASGPANLVVQDIPTPFYLPFGLFPIKQGQHSGFILPSYTIEGKRGLGFQRGGYYFAVSQHLGVTAQADIFTKGSWGFLGNANYVNRYHYNGNVSIGYNYTKVGEVTDPSGYIQKDFSINWTHTQDPKANPGSNFSANVNVVTTGYNQLNGVDAMTRMQNNYSSSISYSKSFPGKPFTFSAALRHSQNTQSGQVTVGLPEMNFGVTQFTPFQRKHAAGIPKWYERITSSYNMRLINNWNFYDSTFSLSKVNLSDFNNGIVHNVNIQASYTVLRFFNLSFSLPYTEYWNTKQVFLNYNSVLDKLDTTINNGFFASRSFSSSVNLSTRIYGIKMFKKGKIAGIRHVITPNIGLSYVPGFAHAPFNYYYYSTTGPNQLPAYRSPYESSYYTPIGGPSPAEPNGSVNFGIGNTLAMKVRTGDSAGTKNISLLDAFNINTSYNMFADSLKLANITMNARTSILKIINISANASFDPYRYNGRIKTNEYLITSGGGLARFMRGGISAGFSYTAQKKNQEQQEDAEKNNDEVARLLRNGGIDDYYDFNIPYDFHLNYTMSANRSYITSREKDTITVDHSVTFGGSFNLTERWRVSYESAYNFTQKKLGTSSLNISRDLHCWQMSLNLIPFGEYKSFNFLLQVKSTVLQDLKLVRRRSYLDNF